MENLARKPQNNAGNNGQCLEEQINNILSLEEPKKAQLLSEGYESIHQISSRLKISYGIIRMVANWIGKLNPNGLEKFGNEEIFVSPEIIKLIEAEIPYFTNYAPEGWKNIEEVQIICQISSHQASRFINKIKPNQEQLRYFKSKSHNGMPAFYFSTDFIELIKEEFKSQKIAPDGWKTVQEIADEIRESCKAILEFIKRIKIGNDEKLKLNIDNSKTSRIYYSPEIIEQIKREFSLRNEINNAPEGWITLNQMTPICKCCNEKIEAILRKVIEIGGLNPEQEEGFYGLYKIRGRSYRFFSPLFVQIVECCVQGGIGKISFNKK